MTRRVKLTVEYDGTDFFGWQVQAKTGERTVQGVLEQALAKLPGDVSSLRAAGRTDTGVHALAMTAHLDADTLLEDAKLTRAINAHLPADVAVLNCETVAADFEAQYDCLYRRYLYRLRAAREDRQGMALERSRVLFVFDTLDIDAMRRAAPLFEGAHDFAALASQETRTTEREIHLCNLREERGELRLHIAADGFLRGMVRTLVGTLLWVGQGRLKPEDIPDILASKDRARAGPKAPPHGLYFVEAGYEAWGFEQSEEAVRPYVP